MFVCLYVCMYVSINLNATSSFTSIYLYVITQLFIPVCLCISFDDITADAAIGYREVEIREQDRFLPVANIARIMKKVLPPNAKIAKEAKESIQTCVSEFISFVTSEASG